MDLLHGGSYNPPATAIRRGREEKSGFDGLGAMVRDRIAGPDFICIGMPKAGTGWLFDQLKHHPDFWLPPAKEISYLSAAKTRAKSAEKWLERTADNAGLFQHWANRTANDTRDIEFLRQITHNIGRDMDLEFYISLFRFKRDAISGDVTAGYCALKPNILSQLQQRLPQTKIILLVRDPIERLWSHLSMWHRQGQFDERLLEKASVFREYLDASGKLQKSSFPTTIVQAWERHAPKLPFRYFLFDDIAQRAETVRSEVLLYLGADPNKTSGGLDAAHNKKSKKKKLELESNIKELLVEYFSDELRACGPVFGGAAKTWAARYGV